MMKNRKIKWLASWLLMLPLLATALEFEEIKEYGEVFRISAQAVNRERIEVSWDIAANYYLYNNKFLAFSTDTPGVMLGSPDIPEGERKFDELLGAEVVKYHGRLTVGLPLVTIPAGVDLVSLRVRSQGCLESVLCYPPTEQLLAASLPVLSKSSSTEALSATGAASLTDIFSPPAARAVQQGSVNVAPALPPDEAFVYEAIGHSSETVLVRFTTQPGYYLYRDKFAFRVVGDAGFVVREVSLPPGNIKDDPEFGPVEVFYDQIEVPVRVNRPAGPEQSITLEADYQGCRDGDICYPPQTSRVNLVMSATAETIQEAVLAKARVEGSVKSEPAVDPQAHMASLSTSKQDKLAQKLLNSPTAALFAFFLAGILLAFTPCVFPMVPILSGIIAGQGERMTTARAFWLSLVYVLAMAATYTVAGVLAGLFGQNLQALFQNPWILGFFIAIFVALALSMFGFFEHITLPDRSRVLA